MWWHLSLNAGRDEINFMWPKGKKKALITTLMCPLVIASMLTHHENFDSTVIGAEHVTKLCQELTDLHIIGCIIVINRNG